MVFVCTHNSRRSHMAQLWARAAAERNGLHQLRTYSAGTEATAFHPHAVRAMRAQGLLIDAAEGTNPRYAVRVLSSGPIELAWSKTLDDPSLPRADFAAVMVCSSADTACPDVPGATLRVSLPFDDPGMSDGTADEGLVYATRSAEIAATMSWMVRSACLPSGKEGL